MQHHLSTGKTRALRGFTIVEILVAIGIIVLLVSILLPFLSKAFRTSGNIRAQADMNSISMAIETYKQTFGDIPRTSGANTGAATLGKALVGPFGVTGDTTLPPYDSAKAYKAGECVIGYVALQDSTGKATSDPQFWAPFSGYDGSAGPGFKVRIGASVSGPYMDLSKTKMQGAFILDSTSRPILYFPARPGRINVSQVMPPMYVERYSSTSGALFNADDNFEAYRHGEGVSENTKVLNRIRIMFGDYNVNGASDALNAAVPDGKISAEYVLVSAGPDGLFGPAGFVPDTNAAANRKAVETCDDVMNVQR